MLFLSTWVRPNHVLKLALIAALTVCGGPAAAQNVGQLWKQNCASCHGEDAGGGSSPTMLDDQWRTDGSDRALYDAVYHGLEEFGMPAFEGGLTEAQSWALIVYLHELRYAAAADERKTQPADDKTVYQSQHEAFRLETVVENLDNFDRPWAIDFLPGRRMIVTERAGHVYVFDQNLKRSEVQGIPEVWQNGQGGLLDVGVLPQPGDVTDPPWVYLSYSVNTPQQPDRGNTMIVRGRIDPETLRWTDHQEIYRPDPQFDNGAGVHFGSRFVFDGKGHVFFVIGERGQNDPSQSLESPVGKIHRLNLDGSVPADNPFVDSPNPSAWSIGHRNPQGLSQHPQTGLLYTVEHAPRGGDELNLIEKGKDYGWPTVSYAMNYNMTPYREGPPWHEPRGFVDPLHYWIPSIAVCGSTFYTGEKFPQWKNDLFVASLAKQELHRIRLSEDGQTVLEDEVVLYAPGRIRDVAQAPDGSLLLALEQPGRIVRLVPAK